MDASANKPNTLCAASWKAYRPSIPRASRVPRAGPPPGPAPSASPAPCFPLTPQAARPDGHECDTLPILWGRASQPCPLLDACGPLNYLPARPSPERWSIEPAWSGLVEARPGSAGVLQAAGDAVDGEEQQPFHPLAVLVGDGRFLFAQRRERPQLQEGQRVHIGVAQRDSAGQHLPARQQ